MMIHGRAFEQQYGRLDSTAFGNILDISATSCDLIFWIEGTLVNYGFL